MDRHANKDNVFGSAILLASYVELEDLWNGTFCVNSVYLYRILHTH